MSDFARVRLLGDSAISVELGYGDIGVFLVPLRTRERDGSDRDRRIVTLAIGESGARKLATALVQAADASERNRARLAELGATD